MAIDATKVAVWASALSANGAVVSEKVAAGIEEATSDERERAQYLDAIKNAMSPGRGHKATADLKQHMNVVKEIKNLLGPTGK